MSEIVSKYIECYVYKETDDGMRYLLLKRSPDKQPYPGIWQIVTGRIEDGEKAYKTAEREVKEETGLSNFNLFVFPESGIFYTMHSDSIHLIPIFIAEAFDEKIVLSSEHVNYGWFKFEECIEKIHWLNQKKIIRDLNNMLLNRHLRDTLIKVIL